MRGAPTYRARLVVLLLVMSMSGLIPGCSQTAAIDTASAEEVPRSPSGFEQDSPEGAVDAYVAAMVADDVDTMWAWHAGRTWPDGEPVTYEQFVAAFREIRARYQAAGIPEDTPCYGGYDISARATVKGAEFTSGESVGTAYRVSVVVQSYENRDGIRGAYRPKKAAFIAWQDDGRWVVAKAEDMMP